MSGRLKTHGIDENKAGEAVERWLRNPFYRMLCSNAGFSSPEQLLYAIDQGDIVRVPVVLDLETKIRLIEMGPVKGQKTRIGGIPRELTEGLIDDYKGDVIVDLSSATSGNPDLIARTPEEIEQETRNYGDSFVRASMSNGASMSKFDLIIILFPSRRSLERGAREVEEELEKSGFLNYLQRTGGTITVRRQTLSGIEAAEGLGYIENGLRFSLPLTILNNTILKPWKHGAPAVYPDVGKIVDLLEAYRNGQVMLGASPIFAYLLALELYERGLQYSNVYVHGGGGGYDGKKGAIVIPDGINQRKYAELMKSVFGRYPTETYGYSGQNHVIVLRWDPEREWYDVDARRERIGAYTARLPDDVCGNDVLVYAVDPLTNELVKKGAGVLRALNFSDGRIHLHGPMQPSDRVYVADAYDTGMPRVIYGIGRLPPEIQGISGRDVKPGC